MTLRRLQLQAEPYASTGNIGENVRRLIGAPAQDPLQTVIREALQNIADAAKLGRGPQILIRVRQLEAQQVAVLKGYILAEPPQERSSREMLDRFLSSPSPTVLEICDFGTIGLCGPTRADRIPIGTANTDFINFLRNVGTPRDTDLGGGTYGFGKAAFYDFSRCRTILVDTLTCEPPFERRLMGCHAGHQFQQPDGVGMLRQYTGRHWWGIRDPQDGVVDPVTGDQAAELASQIGLPGRDFGQYGRTGTSIMILDPDLEDDDLRVAGNRIAEALLWSFWPRLMRDTPKEKRFVCRVKVGEENIEIPAPEDFPPLDLFCKAMAAARKQSGNDVRPIACQRPRMDLGVLALEKGLRAPRQPLVGKESLFGADKPSCHIALMRPVEFVVTYLPGNPLPDDRFEWAGVFLVSDGEEVERAFALSEPPAHDSWIPKNLPKGHGRTFVNVALQRLSEIAASMGGSTPVRPGSTGEMPILARVAGRLGLALAGVTGDGARRRHIHPQGTTRRHGQRARATPPAFQRLVRSGSETIAVFKTDVYQDRERSGARLHAKAAIVMDGGSSVRLDPSIPSPEILEITEKGGRKSVKSHTLALDGAEGSYEIHVRVPPDCAVTAEAVILTGEGD